MDQADDKNLKAVLLSLGAKEDELDSIIGDVNEIVIRKYLADYSTQLSPEDQQKLSKFSEDEIQQYLEENKDTLPKGSSERYLEIARNVWADYFNSMGYIKRKLLSN